jgi:2,4-dienoyl-CoA reductase (NADPH2)
MEVSPTVEELKGFDEVVMSTGVVPRVINLPGSEDGKVSLYNKVLSGEKVVGDSVAIIGAGGIGFDMATYLLHEEKDVSISNFLAEWGVDMEYTEPGGLRPPVKAQPKRDIYLLQRKKTKPGAGLGKTTGWIHRSTLKKNGVKMMTGVEYVSVDSTGLKIRHNGEEQHLLVDDVIICAGQESELGLANELQSSGVKYHLIGGALKAGELDAQRAISQGVEVADAI